MTDALTNLPTLVPLTVQLVPKDGPGITPAEWETRAKRLADLLAEDEFPADQLPDSLRELSLRDETGWSWCYDGSTWWVWDGTAWTNRIPTGILRLMPFTMETQVEEQAPTPTLARRYAATHRVPAAGIPAWSRPDASLQPEHTLAGGLDVMVTEERADGWAHVVFSNDWQAWVDGRRLEAIAS